MAAEPTRDVFRQDLPSDRALTGDDLQRLRFGVALRGYSMSQVDDVLDRLSGELAAPRRSGSPSSRPGSVSNAPYAAVDTTGDPNP